MQACRTAGLIAVMVVMSACGADLPFTGTLPSNTRVSMSGAFRFSEVGYLTLTLALPCRMMVRLTDGSGVTEKRECDASHLAAIDVIAVTPWRTSIPGKWIDAANIIFKIDWNSQGLDPVAANAQALARSPWQVSGAWWVPTEAESQRIQRLSTDGVPNAAESQKMQSGIPNLQVSLDIPRGNLTVGVESTLIVKVANRGSGTAIRVAATTQSTLHALTGHKLAFGSIAPGVEKAALLHVRLPATESALEAALDLQVKEGRGFDTRLGDQHVLIVKPRPVLGIDCKIDGQPIHTFDVDADATVTLICVTINTGAAPAALELDLSLTGSSRVYFPARIATAARRQEIVVPVSVTRVMADTAAELIVTVLDRPSSASAHTKLTGRIRRPRLCKPPITRGQYNNMLAKLRAQEAAGTITHQEFATYEQELDDCLKRTPGSPGQPVSASPASAASGSRAQPASGSSAAPGAGPAQPPRS